MFSVIVFILQFFRGRLYLRIDLLAACRHLCTFFQNHCIVYSFMGIFPPGKRSVIFYREPPELLHNPDCAPQSDRRSKFPYSFHTLHQSLLLSDSGHREHFHRYSPHGWYHNRESLSLPAPSLWPRKNGYAPHRQCLENADTKLHALPYLRKDYTLPPLSFRSDLQRPYPPVSAVRIRPRWALMTNKPVSLSMPLTFPQVKVTRLYFGSSIFAS